MKTYRGSGRIRQRREHVADVVRFGARDVDDRIEASQVELPQLGGVVPVRDELPSGQRAALSATDRLRGAAGCRLRGPAGYRVAAPTAGCGFSPRRDPLTVDTSVAVAGPVGVTAGEGV